MRGTVYGGEGARCILAVGSWPLVFQTQAAQPCSQVLRHRSKRGYVQGIAEEFGGGGGGKLTAVQRYRVKYAGRLPSSITSSTHMGAQHAAEDTLVQGMRGVPQRDPASRVTQPQAVPTRLLHLRPSSGFKRTGFNMA